jgi:hypothetical protein
MAVNKRLNAEELEAIRNRTEAATPGPWYAEDGTKHPLVTRPFMLIYPPDEEDADTGGWVFGEISGQSDAEFIAHARQDVPKLLAEIERLKNVLNYIHELSAEFYTEEDGVFSIPNEQQHKDTMQEIFVISYEAVNDDD